MNRFDIVGFIGLLFTTLPFWLVLVSSFILGLTTFGFIFSKLVREMFLKAIVLISTSLLFIFVSYACYKIYVKFGF